MFQSSPDNLQPEDFFKLAITFKFAHNGDQIPDHTYMLKLYFKLEVYPSETAPPNWDQIRFITNGYLGGPSISIPLTYEEAQYCNRQLSEIKGFPVWPGYENVGSVQTKQRENKVISLRVFYSTVDIHADYVNIWSPGFLVDNSEDIEKQDIKGLLAYYHLRMEQYRAFIQGSEVLSRVFNILEPLIEKRIIDIVQRFQLHEKTINNKK